MAAISPRFSTRRYSPAGERYRGMDWSLELRAAQGDPEATEEMLRRFDIEPLAPGEGVAFL